MNSDEDSQPFPTKRELPVLKTRTGRVVPIKELLRLDQQNLADDYELQAPWSAVIQDICGSFKVQLERQERAVKRTEARKFLSYRDSGAGGKAPSVDVVKALVASDPEVEEEFQKLFELQEQYEAAMAVNMAMQARKDMLVNLGADVRLSRRGS